MIFRFKNKRKNNFQLSSESGAGFTAVELIITIAILAFGVVGLYQAFTPFVSLNYRLSYRLIASYLAQDGLEIVRNLRDNNFVTGGQQSWNHGLLNCSSGCEADYKTGTSTEAPENQLQHFNNNYLNINADGFYSYDTGVGSTPTRFQREVIIDRIASDILKVHVIVTWNYNNQNYSFDTQEYLYNWY